MSDLIERNIVLKIKLDLLKASYLLHFFWFVLILFMWNRQAPEAEAKSEVLAMSITTIEVLLAVLAIILGVGAFAGFWMLKGAAEEAARVEAQKWLTAKGAELIAKGREATEGESDALVEAFTANSAAEDITEKTGGE